MENTIIKAVTFDLWDTVFIDDSDEPKREKAGLAAKPIERRNLVEQFLESQFDISRDHIDIAYNTVDAAFRQVWYGQSITWTVEERLSVLLKGIGCELPDKRLKELVRLHEEMELQIKPDLAENIAEAIEKLGEKYQLGVISDAIFSPGRVLRQILESYGLKKYFTAFVFSDEIQYSKPAAITFQDAAKQLGVEVQEIIHIGDRQKKDIAGPHAVGAKAIYTTVVMDRGSQNTTADAICTNYKELPSIIDNINQIN